MTDTEKALDALDRLNRGAQRDEKYHALMLDHEYQDLRSYIEQSGDPGIHPEYTDPDPLRPGLERAEKAVEAEMARYCQDHSEYEQGAVHACKGIMNRLRSELEPEMEKVKGGEGGLEPCRICNSGEHVLRKAYGDFVDGDTIEGEFSVVCDYCGLSVSDEYLEQAEAMWNKLNAPAPSQLDSGTELPVIVQIHSTSYHRAMAALETIENMHPDTERLIAEVTAHIQPDSEGTREPSVEREAYQSEVDRLKKIIAEKDSMIENMQAESGGEVWYWDPEGFNELSMLTCPVQIHAHDLRALIRDNRKHAAQGTREDGIRECVEVVEEWGRTARQPLACNSIIRRLTALLDKPEPELTWEGVPLWGEFYVSVDDIPRKKLTHTTYVRKGCSAVFKEIHLDHLTILSIDQAEGES